jgi:hypothetical protein
MKHEPHQLLEEELTPPKEELDEEEIEDLMLEVLLVLNQIKDRKLPKRLQSDVAYLLKKIEDAVSWHKLQ